MLLLKQFIATMYLSVSLKIGEEGFTKEDSNENVMGYGYHLKTYSIDEEGILHPIPQEPQNMNMKYEC